MFEKLEFCFLGVTIKKLENIWWQFGKFSTLYLSAFFCVLFQILRSGSPRNFVVLPPRSRDMTSLKHLFLKMSRRVLQKFSEVT